MNSMTEGQEVTISAVVFNLDEITREIDRLRVQTNTQVMRDEMNTAAIRALATRLQRQADKLKNNIDALTRAAQ